jgi:predicted nucleotidyltransferase
MNMNRESAVPELSQVMPILQSLKPYLYERWGITGLAIFGSVARGESQAGSDIDILFDYDRPMGLEIVTFGDFLEERLQFKVDLLSKKAIRPQVWNFICDEMYYV